MSQPSFELEQTLISQGYSRVAGVDEVGRGCWAGMVTVGAVHFERVSAVPSGIRDSKLLTPKRRSELFSEILLVANVGIGSADENEIDSVGIVGALGLAAERALNNLSTPVDAVILDGNSNYLTRKIHTVARPKADDTSMSVAAASIMAKVTRDRLMELLDAAYPGYGFASHKGYGSTHHQKMLDLRGLSEVHRRSYAPMKFMTA
jgi:ribonuclease HII